jgi:uncharacterized membrane protein YbaN (DUF454 family)
MRNAANTEERPAGDAADSGQRDPGSAGGAGGRPLPWLVGAGLWTAGTILLGLGLVGIILPLVPTTPLLLLAAACYVRVSPRAYHWLLRNPMVGPVIHRWRAERTVPARAKWTGVLLVFSAFAASVLLVPNCVYGYVTLFILGSALIVFLASLPTTRVAIRAQHPPGA